MIMNIQEIASASAQIKELLVPLADKIGQTGQYVFGLFVRQVYVNAITGLLWWFAAILILSATPRFQKWTKKEDEEIAGMIISCCAVILALFLFLLPLSNLIGSLINPEYKAIELIISTLRTGTN